MDGFESDLLPIYIFAEVVRQFSEYYGFNTTSGIVPHLPRLVSEVLKLLVATTYIFFHKREGYLALVSNISSKDFSEFLRYSLPAALDTVGTALYLVALSFTSPSILQVIALARLPATLLLHHIWVRRARSQYSWSCVLYIFIGLALFKFAPLAGEGTIIHWLVALSLGLIFACISAASNISSEALMKSGDFWQSQTYIYANGVIFSILSFPITAYLNARAYPQHEAQAPQHTAVVIFTVATALSGLAAAGIWRERDNTVKFVGAVTSLLFATTMLYYAQPVLRIMSTTSFTTVGGLLAGAALWGYNNLKDSNNNNKGNDIRDDQTTGRYEQLPLEQTILLSEFVTPEEDSEEIQRRGEEDGKPLMPGPTLSMIDNPGISARIITFPNIWDALTFGRFSGYTITLEAVKSGFLCALIGILPSFILPRQKGPQKAIHPTAYLDGLRGVAASSVFLYHTASAFYPQLEVGWTGGPDQNLFFQLPWIRWFLSGHSMVATFFVVSGFSLSYGPLKRIRSDDMTGFSTSLASSIFRRWMRLFIPTAVITFIDMSMIALSKDGLRGIPKEPFFVDQFWQWFLDNVQMTNPLRGLNTADGWLSNGSIYEGALWTIPVEFRGSIVVFCFLLGCARLHSSMRMMVISVCAIIGLHYLYWDIFLFLMGCVLSEVHLINKTNAIGTENQNCHSQHMEQQERAERAWDKTYLSTMERVPSIFSAKNLRTMFWIANFLIATYILSMQSRILYPIGQGTYGYVFIWSLTPSQYLHQKFFFRFWPAIGSVYLVWTLDHSLLLQGLFTNRFTNYLSRISYSIYLVHPPIVFLVTIPLTNWIWAFTGNNTGLNYTWGFILGNIICVPLTYWSADIFTRIVDENAVKFSKWWYKKLLEIRLA